MRGLVALVLFPCIVLSAAVRSRSVQEQPILARHQPDSQQFFSPYRDYFSLTHSNNNEGEAHDKIQPPEGSIFTSIPIRNESRSEIAVFRTRRCPDEGTPDSQSQHVFVIIHGKLRDGDSYWKSMHKAVSTAVQNKLPGATENSIIVAPQFFSTKYNRGQYSTRHLGWEDVNAWQAGDRANHPSGTKTTSLDALDSIVDHFSDRARYPMVSNITVIGHGGGGQLAQRYAILAEEPPRDVYVRYIHGDPSTCAYFTKDRPAMDKDSNVPSKEKCENFNDWRYGFDSFPSGNVSEKQAQQFFRQYVSRDVICLIGLKDTAPSGDQTCAAHLQGGSKRRDRNLVWWRYVNTLARTKEDLEGFPGRFDEPLPDWSDVSGGTIRTRLVVVKEAEHNVDELFASKAGMSILFSNDTIDTGWRPKSGKLPKR